jgi:S-DNA-T family DNA segregation ATPase FtsK/SpoIIIE
VQDKALTFTLAGALSLWGIYLLIAILCYALGPLSLFILLPGRFLFSSYSWGAIFIPLYFFSCAGILIMSGFQRKLLIVLGLLILPFLTISLFLRILVDPASAPVVDFFLSRFGQRGSLILLVLLTAIEVLTIFRLILFPHQPGKYGSDAVDEQGEGSAVKENAGKTGNREAERPGFLELKLDIPDIEIDKRQDVQDPGPPVIAVRKEVLSQASAQEELPEHRKLNLDEPVFILPDNLVPPSKRDAVDDLRGRQIRTAGAGVVEIEEEAELLVEEDPSEVPPAPLNKKRVKYEVPMRKLLNEYTDSQYWIIDEETKTAAEVLRQTLEEFRIKAEVTGIRKGPVITMFEILPAPGVKLSKIVNLADNIALRLAASRVRIVAPIPGKHAVGIEVPNKHRAIVSFQEMIDSGAYDNNKMEIPIILGKDITGDVQIIDLVQTPHLLIAGATGSGKSVCVNSIICSILYSKNPEEVRLLLIDPKIVELKMYNDIPHLLTPVVTESKRAFQALQYCIYEMERRYSLLDALGVRDIRSYNKKIKERHLATSPLPYIVIVVDEFADLMATTGKELESTIARLAAMSRAVGLHLILATQRPSIDVITGLIKANIPSRIAFMVAGKFDSRIIIDQVGADKLLGRGDMLFTSAWDPNPNRIQGAFLSEEEVERIADHVRTLGEPNYIDDEIFFDDDDELEAGRLADKGTDPLMDKALEIVVQAGKASASYLQRRLKIGYNRAARMVEDMEMRGIVGPQNGSKPREILHVPDRVPKE